MNDSEVQEVCESCARKWPSTPAVYWPEFANSIKHLPYQRVTAAIQAHFDNAKFAPRPGDIRGAGNRVEDKPMPRPWQVFRAELNAPPEWSDARVVLEWFRRQIQTPFSSPAYVRYAKSATREHLGAIGVNAETAEWAASNLDIDENWQAVVEGL
jgi:hypothetical protein